MSSAHRTTATVTSSSAASASAPANTSFFSSGTSLVSGRVPSSSHNTSSLTHLHSQSTGVTGTASGSGGSGTTTGATAGSPPSSSSSNFGLGAHVPGRAFAVSRDGRILTWTKYTSNTKPLRLDESFGRKKMAIVIPRKVADYQRTQLREPRRYGNVHVSDSINIRDFTEPRAAVRQRPPPREPRHFNINKYT